MHIYATSKSQPTTGAPRASVVRHLQIKNQITSIIVPTTLVALITMSQQSYALFCMGNPLLDIQVTNGEQLLKKYNLNANDAILADEKHLPMLDTLSSHSTAS